MPSVDWDNQWTTSTLNGTSIADGSNDETAAISNDTKTETLISVEVQYGATANESAEVLIQHDRADWPLRFTVSDTQTKDVALFTLHIVALMGDDEPFVLEGTGNGSSAAFKHERSGDMVQLGVDPIREP